MIEGVVNSGHDRWSYFLCKDRTGRSETSKS